ncbi:MAG: hypothetical protein P8X57_08155, partial [Cyclobacteriaceae bacterium]
MIRWSYWLIVYGILLSACNSTVDPDPVLTGSDYFPLTVGHFIEYDVQETTYSLNSGAVERSYQIRQEIADSIVNQSGSTTFVIYRYRRDSENDAWTFLTTWSARLENNRIVVQEGNIPFIK